MSGCFCHFNGYEVKDATARANAGEESAQYPGCYFRNENGVAEWINPPLIAGVEYRTAERYKGKVVYTKLINFGYLPNATKGGIANEVNSTLVIRCEGVTSNGYTLPYNYNGSAIDLCAEKGWILITTNKDYSTTMADIQLWYTKN